MRNKFVKIFDDSAHNIGKSNEKKALDVMRLASFVNINMKTFLGSERKPPVTEYESMLLLNIIELYFYLYGDLLHENVI